MKNEFLLICCSLHLICLIFHSSFFIEFCEAKFLWASRFAAKKSLRRRLFLWLASGYPLHHLHGFASLAVSVVPLLSLSLRPLRGRMNFYLYDVRRDLPRLYTRRIFTF
jgi:hypothetical protein